MEELQSPQVAAVPLPRELAVAKRRAVPGPTDRSMGCPQKRSSPYIRRAQHTVLSVAGLKGTMSEAELHIIRARLDGGIRNKAAPGELRRGLPEGFVWGERVGEVLFHPDEAVTGPRPGGLRTLRRVRFGAPGLALVPFRGL